jgi:hypothetical protein
VRKLKKLSRKYKGNLPFKCFNCGRVGHFWLNVHMKKGKTMMINTIIMNNKITKKKIKRYKHKRGKNTKKKSFYSRKDISSSEESDGYVSDINKK